MKKTVELIKNFFEKGDWKYKYQEYNDTRATFISGINMNNAMGNLNIIIDVRSDYYVVNMILNSLVEKNFYAQVAEYLHRANYNMNNGNFEFDFDEGEINYKTFVNFDNMELSEEVITDSILVPIFMFKKYGKNLLRLLLSENNPKELIEEVENEEFEIDEE